MSTPPNTLETHDPSAGRRRVGLWWLGVGLLVLWAAGAYLPGPRAWGFNHLAYLPVWVRALWGVAALALLVPQTRAALSRVWQAAPDFVFRGWLGALAVALVLSAVFWLLRARAFFMGDGYLVGELVERKIPFRGFDAMDYLAHYELYHWTAGFTKLGSFTFYQILSVIAGALFVVGVAALARRLDWEPWRQLFVFGLAVTSGLSVLFCGYVESYTYLYLWITVYLFTAVLVLEGRASLWVASLFYGCAVSSHLTGVFSGLPLLYLALRAPVGSAWRRWIEAAVPALLVFSLAVAAHYAAGYNEAWFRRDFLDNRHAQSLWVPWTGYAGFFSPYHWKDMVNLVLISTPVAAALVLARLRTIVRGRTDPRVQLLGLQILATVAVGIALDRKLGGARDWDLLAAHSGAIYLLAALVLDGTLPLLRRPPVRGAGRAVSLGGTNALAPFLVGVSILLTVPWLLVQAGEARSIERFVSVAGDFPNFQRAYAYEEVGKYWRKKEDLTRALHYYELCVQSFPSNARFHVLYGSVALARSAQADVEPARRAELEAQAEASLRKAVELQPEMALAQRHLGRLFMMQNNFDEAIPLYKALISKAENQPTVSDWEAYGVSCLQAGQWSEAVRALERVRSVDPDARVRHPLGAAYMGVRNYSAAITILREALERGEGNEEAVRYGLAASIVSAVTIGAMEPAALDEAETLTRELLQAKPSDPDVLQVLQQIQQLRATLR